MNTTENGLGAAVLFAVLAGTLPVAAADVSSGTEPVVKRKVYQRPVSDEYVTANFGVNRNLGRAWIEVAASPWVDVQQRDIIVRKSIRGLYYDPDRKAVIYRHGATETICAEDRSLLGGISLKTTENCELQVRFARPIVNLFLNDFTVSISLEIDQSTSRATVPLNCVFRNLYCSC